MSALTRISFVAPLIVLLGLFDAGRAPAQTAGAEGASQSLPADGSDNPADDSQVDGDQRRADRDASVAFFEKHIRPLLISRCQECHSSESDAVGGNLLLDSREGWRTGGDLGPAIVPGDPEQSLLVAAVKQTHDELEMPPDGRLSATEIRHLEDWIRQGAIDPRSDDVPMADGTPRDDLEIAQSHWAFQPIAEVQPPPLDRSGGAWAENEIDRFIAFRYQQLGLTPVSPADRRTLIRRATFDLLGVPPTPSEVDRFIADRRPNAYARLIDRLLASPRYGERWGRHWLDVARYADSNGLDENAAHGNAWRYRDYVIEAFNRDLSYDQFVREQLAGDQLAGDDEAVRRRRTIATGYLVLGPKVLAEGDEKKMEMDIIDEQIETVGRGFMGLTLGCARCHDHKFDPISTKDYYRLVGIFGSTKTMEDYKRIAKWNEITVATATEKEQQRLAEAEVEASKKRLEEFIEQANENLLATLADDAELPKQPEEHYDERTREQLETLRKELAERESAIPTLPTAMAVADRSDPKDQPVLVRGSHLTPGEMVPRGFPTVLVSHRDWQRYTIPKQQSGRLQLARWLTDDEHPLTARVMVNRIWRWHFGRGITPSTDNFGLLGDQPSHPELLDWLARCFVRDGWSIKKLHRRIMLSATYQLSTMDDSENRQLDPANVSLWRFRLRRLEAEELLDSLHAVSGLLDRRMGGSLLQTENRVLVFNHTSEDKTTYESPRRAVYLPVIRNHLADVFQLFDYSEASVMTSDRPSTTVATQALFLMNSETANRAAREFARRLLGDPQQDDRTLLLRAYQLAYGRAPNDRELSRDLQYLARFQEQFEDALSSEDSRGDGSGNGDAPAADLSPRHRAWRVLCHTLLASSEFCYVR